MPRRLNFNNNLYENKMFDFISATIGALLISAVWAQDSDNDVSLCLYGIFILLNIFIILVLVANLNGILTILTADSTVKNIPLVRAYKKYADATIKMAEESSNE